MCIFDQGKMYKFQLFLIGLCKNGWGLIKMESTENYQKDELV